MANSINALEKLISPLPEEVREHFGIRDASLTLEWIGLYNAKQALEETNIFRSFHPIVSAFDGVVLDDPNTSDHHIYLSKYPLTGMIMFLSHDGNTRIVFRSLRDFLASARLAVLQENYVDQFHPARSPLCDDQAALSGLISELIDDPDADTLIPALLPSLDLQRSQIAAALATHEDFFVSEALANAIASRPSRELKELAVLCLTHPHVQARVAANRALEAIKDLRD